MTDRSRTPETIEKIFESAHDNRIRSNKLAGGKKTKKRQIILLLSLLCDGVSVHSLTMSRNLVMFSLVLVLLKKEFVIL